jgi:hypothetical protein
MRRSTLLSYPILLVFLALSVKSPKKGPKRNHENFKVKNVQTFLSITKIKVSKIGTRGLYYKHITIVCYAYRVIRMTPQLGASLTTVIDDTSQD